MGQRLSKDYMRRVDLNRFNAGYRQESMLYVSEWGRGRV